MYVSGITKQTLGVLCGGLTLQGVLVVVSRCRVAHPSHDAATVPEVIVGCSACCCTQGFAGSSPNPRQLAQALQRHDLFLYFGHGGGEQYVPLAALKRLDRCAGALLMGCSSGRLRRAGVYEASGPIWGYLMAGEGLGRYVSWNVAGTTITGSPWRLWHRYGVIPAWHHWGYALCVQGQSA